MKGPISLLKRMFQHPIAPVWAALGWVVIFLTLGGGEWKDHLFSAFGMTAAFALAARLLRAVDTMGTLTGAATAFLCYVVLWPTGFILLLFVFVLTWAVTRYGRRRKQALGTAEPSRGRTSFQVWANLQATTIFLALSAFSSFDPDWLIAGAIAALAEVAADTTSSELGQTLAPAARLITTFESVPPGTDGGISAAGTVAGVVAALSTSAAAIALKLVDVPTSLVIAAAAIVGMLVDSVLGAVFERKGGLTNDGVNAWSTLFAAFAATIAAALIL